MNRSLLRRAALGLLLFCATGGASSASEILGNLPAPAFSLKDRDGRVHTLADFKGRVVLIDFWASWCAPCKQSFPALDSLHQEFHDVGLEVVAINVDEDTKNAHEFLAGKSPVMTVLFDPKGKSPEAFKVEGMPSSFLIDRDGRVRFRHQGFTAQTKADFRREISILIGDVVHAQQ
jgi:cytochrome c biogenesis protein CcmG/thiol:disulfide interchange protein DsbE